jgi:hypothetical protein
MAKRKSYDSTEKRTRKRRLELFSNLKDETLQGVLAVLAFVGATLSILSAWRTESTPFGKAGIAGHYFFDWLHFLFGIGYDPLYINDYGKFIQYVGTGEYKTPERSVVTFPINGKYTPQAIDFLGVKYIIHKKSDGALAWAFPFNKYPIDKFVKVYEDNFYDVFQNKTPFDRAFVVSKVFQSNTFNLFDYDLKKVAFVDDSIPGLKEDGSGNAKILKYSANSVEIEANTNGPALLVLTDIFYPGWRAEVNGKPSKIYKTNYTFRGVMVPGGKSNITFTYMPESFLIGIYLFLIGIMGMVVFSVVRKFSKN